MYFQTFSWALNPISVKYPHVFFLAVFIGSIEICERDVPERVMDLAFIYLHTEATVTLQIPSPLLRVAFPEELCTTYCA